MRTPHSRLKAWTPNARQAVRSLALQGEVRLPNDAESLEPIWGKGKRKIEDEDDDEDEDDSHDPEHRPPTTAECTAAPRV